MATKQEITAAIREGIEHVERTFGALTDDQLRVKVHEADGGWTAKEILAHLAEAWLADRAPRTAADLLAEAQALHPSPSVRRLIDRVKSAIPPNR